MASVIAFIGAGNMGGSLIGGLIQNGHPADHIWATDPDKAKCKQLADTFHIHSTQNNAEAAKQADILIFAVKPQILKIVAEELASVIQERKPLVISIAAGVRESSLQNWLGGSIAIVRAMPNTPALIGAGASGLYANKHVSQEQHNLAESILRAVGIAVWVKSEEQMDVVTALSGSGPAYFFLIMEALQEAAEAFGLPSDTARLLALQTALGAGKMAIESAASPAELRLQVTSPGGTTESAVTALENHHIRDIFKSAVQAAKERSEELADLLGDNT